MSNEYHTAVFVLGLLAFWTVKKCAKPVEIFIAASVGLGRRVHRSKQKSDEAVKLVTEYRVSKKTLAKKVEDKDLTKSVALQEVELLQMELARANVENKIMTKSTEKMFGNCSFIGKTYCKDS